MKHDPLPPTGQDGDVIDRRAMRTVLSLGLVAAAAWLLSAPVSAALVAGLIAAFFTWIASKPLGTPPALLPPPPMIETPDRTNELIDAVDDVLLIIDRQRITHANAAARRLFGAEKTDGDFRLALRHPIAAELIASDRETEAPVEIAGLGEPDRRWAMSVRRIAGGARLVTLRDRTDSWVAERMRVDFVANASHELRTPLATILGFVETLEGSAGEDPATRARFLGIMLGEAKRMQQLVDDLISLSRIEADRFAVPQDILALGPVIDEVVGVVRSGMCGDADRILVETERVPNIRADRVQIGQLLHNLIGNAVKYGRPGTPIRVSLKGVDDKVSLRITDEGDGIAPEHLPRLTERFYRADPGRSRSVGGTGLGLAIVKHIAERHRATLDIASKVGEGTAVTVTFPACPPDSMSS